MDNVNDFFDELKNLKPDIKNVLKNLKPDVKNVLSESSNIDKSLDTMANMLDKIKRSKDLEGDDEKDRERSLSSFKSIYDIEYTRLNQLATIFTGAIRRDFNNANDSISLKSIHDESIGECNNQTEIEFISFLLGRYQYFLTTESKK